MQITLQGEQIFTEKDFHKQFAKALNIESIYIYSLAELWDVLHINLGQNLTIIWFNSDISKQNLGEDFAKIISVFNAVKVSDESLNCKEKFDFYLK